MAYSVVTNYKTTLSAPMTTSQLTVPVNSILTNDFTPHTIETADMGNGWYLTIAPGTSNEEIVLVTAVTASGTAGSFTVSASGRGLAFYGTSDSQVSGNAYAHNPGDVVILSNVKNVYDRLVDKETSETIAGVKTFSSSPLVPTPTSSETTAAASVAYVNAVAIAGAPDASTTVKGIVEEATAAELAAGTAAGATSARLFANPSTLAAQIQKGSWLYFVEDGTGSDDTYTATLTPTLTAYTAGQIFVGKFTVANTGACTLNLDGLGAKDMKKYVAGAIADLATGDIVANQPLFLEYDGTYMVVLNPSAAMPTTANLQLVSSSMATLAGGATTNADAYHTHTRLVNSISVGYTVAGTGAQGGTDYPCGFSDATTKVFALGAAGGGASSGSLCTFALDPSFARAYVLRAGVAGLTKTKVAGGVLAIGSDYWSSQVSGGGTIQKNGSDVTFSGTARNGPLGHNPTTSSLLVLYSTTKIAQFSGISGTTITNLNSDITLDTAVTATVGFLYDNTNSRYICLDTSNNLIRRFNSSGTTIDTLAYTIDDTKVVGLISDGYRVYIVTQVSAGAEATGAASQGDGTVMMFAIPTTMTI